MTRAGFGAVLQRSLSSEVLLRFALRCGCMEASETKKDQTVSTSHNQSHNGGSVASQEVDGGVRFPSR